ncbi:terminal uridylyltransferase Tailor-like [Armigeres subalbatus]|uniref:terminal uridylyltransferase Tailor-like n=1 Tax=Armigeres subalbatus TaxID=124917 RepID=UPI002ED21889
MFTSFLHYFLIYNKELKNMQAPKQELFLLNWEISNLTTKLQAFANIYSKLDYTTLDCLSKLIDTVYNILSKASPMRCADWDAKDDKILIGYSFHHTINCKQCGRAVKMTRTSLLKHLKEHKSGKISSQVIKLTDDDLDLVAALDNIGLNVGEICSQKSSTKLYNRTDIAMQNSDNAMINSERDTPDSIVVHLKKDDTSEQNSFIGKEQRKTHIPTKQNALEKTNQKQKEPKRKAHVPIRLIDGDYTAVGSIPNTKFDLSKKTKKFIINITPKTRFMVHKSRRHEILESPAHHEIVLSLESAFQTCYPRAKAYLFGSRINGLGNECSDLDIYLDLENNYDGSLKYSKDKLKFFVELTEKVFSLTDQWTKLDPVISARTPILRAWNTKHKIDCDISFTHGLSHSNTRLIQYFFELQPVCYYVALYAKEWSHSFSMPGLNTYTIILLTIFYFQKHKFLPSVQKLQKMCKTPYLISYWQANFEKQSLESLEILQIPEENIHEQLINFFSFYGIRFCFDTQVVCPFLGKAQLKTNFDPYDGKISSKMETLLNYYNSLNVTKAHPINDLLSYMKPMVVQDPLELNHNVAKGLSPTDVNRFRKYCAHTADLLGGVLDETS